MGTYFRGSEGRVLMAFTLSAVIHSVIAACRDVFRPLTHRTITLPFPIPQNPSRSSKSCRQEGRYTAVCKCCCRGGFLISQFGYVPVHFVQARLPIMPHLLIHILNNESAPYAHNIAHD